MTKNSNTRTVLLIAAAVVAGLLFILGDGLADYAKTRFWQVFWQVAGFIGLGVFLGGWVALKISEKKAINKERKW